MSDVAAVVKRAVTDLNGNLRVRVPIERGREAPLFGDEGVLDSLELVRLVLELEDAVEEYFGVVLRLADERAVSQTVSPFRTVGTLTEYVERLLNETQEPR